MKKTFVIQVEYPDNDVIPSDEIMEVTQECIENHLEIKLDTMYDPVTENYFIFAKLELDGKVISEDRIEFNI